MEFAVQLKTITPGLASERAAAASAILSAISSNGLCHLPVMRSRVTWTSTPAGAYLWNCASARRLLEGMIRPMMRYRELIDFTVRPAAWRSPKASEDRSRKARDALGAAHRGSRAPLADPNGRPW